MLHSFPWTDSIISLWLSPFNTINLIESSAYEMSDFYAYQQQLDWTAQPRAIEVLIRLGSPLEWEDTDFGGLTFSGLAVQMKCSIFDQQLNWIKHLAADRRMRILSMRLFSNIDMTIDCAYGGGFSRLKHRMRFDVSWIEHFRRNSLQWWAKSFTFDLIDTIDWLEFLIWIVRENRLARLLSSWWAVRFIDTAINSLRRWIHRRSNLISCGFPPKSSAYKSLSKFSDCGKD